MKSFLKYKLNVEYLNFCFCSYDTQTPPPTNRTGSHHDYDYHGSSGSNARYGDRHYTSNSGYVLLNYDDKNKMKNNIKFKE